MRTGATVLALLVLTTHARADVAPEPAGDKSETTAVALPIAITAAGVGGAILGASGSRMNGGLFAVSALAIAVGPSAGSWYAGASGWRGLALRGIGAGVGGLGLALAASNCCDDGDDQSAFHLGVGLAIAGAAAVATGVVVGILDGKHDAHDANQRAWSIAPTVVTAPGAHTPSPGVGLSLRF